MQRKSLVLLSFVASFIATGFMGTGSALAATPGTYQVMIMTHLCNSTIKNVADFNAMENGRDPVLNLGKDVLACPTTGLPANTAASGTVAAPRTSYNFTVSSDSETKTLASNGSFMPIKACESDLGFDLNSDGKVASSTCLDISHYTVPITTKSGSSTNLKIVESQAPPGYRFGTLRFTPVAVDKNNDSQSFTYMNPMTGEIDLNMVADSDGMVMLHVYQFVYQFLNSDSGNGTSTATTTGSMGNHMCWDDGNASTSNQWKHNNSDGWWWASSSDNGSNWWGSGNHHMSSTSRDHDSDHERDD